MIPEKVSEWKLFVGLVYGKASGPWMPSMEKKSTWSETFAVY